MKKHIQFFFFTIALIAVCYYYRAEIQYYVQCGRTVTAYGDCKAQKQIIYGNK